MVRNTSLIAVKCWTLNAVSDVGVNGHLALRLTLVHNLSRVDELHPRVPQPQISKEGSGM